MVDATRRTRLAAERTYLAWWRSALAAFAVSLGVGKVVPEPLVFTVAGIVLGVATLLAIVI